MSFILSQRAQAAGYAGQAVQFTSAAAGTLTWDGTTYSAASTKGLFVAFVNFTSLAATGMIVCFRGDGATYPNFTNTNYIQIGTDGDIVLQLYDDAGLSATSESFVSIDSNLVINTWYRLVWSVDTTQATNTNRVKLYINSTDVATKGSPVWPAQNQAVAWDSDRIGLGCIPYSTVASIRFGTVWFKSGVSIADVDGATTADKLNKFGAVGTNLGVDLGASGNVAAQGGGSHTPEFYMSDNKANYSGPPSTIEAAWNTKKNLGAGSDWNTPTTPGIIASTGGGPHD